MRCRLRVGSRPVTHRNVRRAHWGSFAAEITEKASNKMRSIVSRQKKRYTYGNYDLDLSCI